MIGVSTETDVTHDKQVWERITKSLYSADNWRVSIICAAASSILQCNEKHDISTAVKQQCCIRLSHRCKKTFFNVFLFWSRFLRFLTFFYFSNVFLFLKNVGKVQSGKQINKKHFQNNSNEIDL